MNKLDKDELEILKDIPNDLLGDILMKQKSDLLEEKAIDDFSEYINLHPEIFDQAAGILRNVWSQPVPSNTEVVDK